MNRSAFVIMGPITLLISIPLWAGNFITDALILFLLYVTVAELWGFMTKHAGIISLGQQMFLGVGGYATAILAMYYGLDILVSGVFSAIFGVLLAFLLSHVLLKMRGMYFAVSTFLMAELIKLFFNGWEFVGAGKGIIFRAAYSVHSTHIYYASLTLFLLSITTIYYIYHSKLGYGLRAVGSDEDAAEHIGINTFRLKMIIFIIASLISTWVGSVHAINRTYLHPMSAFNISWTVDFLFIAVIGGVGTIMGPIVGGVIFIILRYLFAQYLGLSLLLEGSVVLAILLMAPQGVWGIISKRLKLNLPRIL